MEETIVPLQRVKKVIGLEAVSSTQDLALELAQKGEPSATLVLACEQTAARRQDGTRFAAAEGGVYFTLILRPSQNEGAAASLARQAALAAADTLGEMFAVRTKVKPDHSVLAWDGKNRQWKSRTAKGRSPVFGFGSVQGHSVRRAVTGSLLAALLAGIRPPSRVSSTLRAIRITAPPTGRTAFTSLELAR